MGGVRERAWEELERGVLQQIPAVLEARADEITDC